MSKKLFGMPILVIVLVSLALATVAAAPPPQEGGKTYTIQKDDWLSKLADKEYGDPLAFTAIFFYNNLKAAEDDSLAFIENPDLIEVGWTIYLPSPEEAATYLAENPPGGTDDDSVDDMSNANEGDASNSNDDDGSNSNDDDASNSNDDDGSNSNDDDGSNSNDDDSNSNDDDGSNSNDDDGSSSTDDDGSNSNDDD